MFSLRLFGFIFRSIKASFHGEALTHLLTVSTICVSLTLVGSVYLAQQNLQRWAEGWASTVAVAIFVAPDIGDNERRALAKEISDKIGLDDAVWTAPDAAAVELAGVVGVEHAEGLGRFTPWVVEGKRGPRTKLQALDALAKRKEVLYVDHGTVLAERLRQVSTGIASGGAAISLLLLLGSFLVVSNTVGLALNARRDEVEIMDLVGTPLEWIYSAYLAEGVLLGVAGAAAAVGLIQAALLGAGGDWLATLGVPTLSGFSLGGGLALLCIGGAIGAAGSAISIRRFLAK